MWEETNTLEKSIILSIHKKSLTITEIAKNVKRAKPTISKTVERMQKQDLVKKNHKYAQDARKIEISINPKRIKIEMAHMFYLIYYILIFIFLAISMVLSVILKNFFIILGSILIALPVFLLMLYHVYIKRDEVIVYKNPQIIKKELKQELIEEPKIS